MHRLFFLSALLGVLLLAGCRGTPSDEPPVHLNLNMDFQEKFDPQEANAFFADGRAMRMPVPGTVARGMLKEDVGFYQGRAADGSFLPTLPLPITQDLLARGRRQYDIYCAVCHGRAGDGQGVIMTGGFGYVPAPNYHDANTRQLMAADGYVFDAISNGIRTMPAYGQQLAVADRWAIVAYIRALQRSQNASAADLPPSELAQLLQGGAVSDTTGTQP